MGMKAYTITTALATALALTACGGGTPKAPAGGLKDMDVSKVKSVDGRRIDGATMRTRRINGIWSGMRDGAEIQANFATDGGLSVDLMRNGSIAEHASGTWSWQSDNTLAGDLSGTGSTFGGLGRWSAGFPTPDHMMLRGAGGSLDLHRMRSVPRPVQQGHGVVTADMMAPMHGGTR